MKIGKRLTMQFTVVVGLIFACVLFAVYLLAFYNTQTIFYERLKERVFIVANIFLEKDELSKERIQYFEKKFAHSLAFEHIQIYDDKKNIVYTNDAKATPLSNNVFNNIVENDEFSFGEGERQYFGLHYKDNQGNFVITASAIDRFGNKKLNFLLLVCFSAYVFSLLLIYLVGKRFSRKALEPIINVITEVKKITLSNLDLRVVEGKNKDEIDELANTFNDMLQRLQNSFEVEKTFISNASHELRTPLTIIIGELQVLLSKQRNVEELNNTSKVILEQSVQMKELVNSLLLLSQIENSDKINFNEDVRLDELLLEIIQNMNSKYNSKPVQLNLGNLPDESQSLTIKGNRLLLYSAISNLIENGIKFSSEKTVTCSLNCLKSKIEIIISDKGIGIPENDIKQLFHPFFRADNARIFKGHGIGLSLSHEIFKKHDAKIELNSILESGTTFIISF
jgi:signal transduction histidine kinase